MKTRDVEFGNPHAYFGRGGGDRKDKILNKACDLYALQLPAQPTRTNGTRRQLGLHPKLEKLQLCHARSLF
jgi:hypothetical protein